MRRIFVLLMLVLFTAFGAPGASAAVIDLFDWGFNDNGIIFGPGDPLPASFDTSFFDFNTGFGSVTVTYNPVAPGNFSLFSFFDHEIDQDINTFFNEYGSASGSPLAGQSWEIDEPGFSYGDIFQNFTNALLDNSNGVPQSAPDDVSMALGWNFALNAGDIAVITLLLNSDQPLSGFYLTHTDPDSGASIYFSSTLDIVPIPIPGTIFLLGSGIAGLVGLVRKRTINA